MIQYDPLLNKKSSYLIYEMQIPFNHLFPVSDKLFLLEKVSHVETLPFPRKCYTGQKSLKTVDHKTEYFEFFIAAFGVLGSSVKNLYLQFFIRDWGRTS